MNMEDVAASLQHSIKDFVNHLEDELGKVRYSLGDNHDIDTNEDTDGSN